MDLGTQRLGRTLWLILALALGACDSRNQGSQAAEVPDRETEELSALGYVAGSDPAGSTSGVTRYVAGRTEPGVNLFTSGHGPVALLIDMEGRVLHEWRADFAALFPGSSRAAKGPPANRNYLRVARMLPDGGLIAIWDLYGIFELDRDSRIVWVVPVKAHHDLQIGDDGRIYHLEALRRQMSEIPEGPATEDFIVVRDPDGVELRRVAISEALREAGWVDLRKIFWLRSIARGYELGERARFDPFHTNALWILSAGEAARMGPPFEAGDTLVSMAMLDTIADIDLEGGRARWWQQGPFGMQHHPRPTPDGDIVVFNNHKAADRSSVQILDPRTRRVTREYSGTPSGPFFSRRSGGAEILPGGNLLLVETDRGRALELSPEGEVEWEFHNPFRVGEHGDRVAAIYSLQRIPLASVEWLR